MHRVAGIFTSRPSSRQQSECTVEMRPPSGLATSREPLKSEFYLVVLDSWQDAVDVQTSRGIQELGYQVKAEIFREGR